MALVFDVSHSKEKSVFSLKPISVSNWYAEHSVVCAKPPRMYLKVKRFTLPWKLQSNEQVI